MSVISFDCLPISVNLTGQCSLRQRGELPNASGIYFVTCEPNSLLYIGQATNLRNRWAGTGHHRYKQLSRKGLDEITISYVLVPVADLDNLEYHYIQTLKPQLNDGKVGQILPKENLRLFELKRLLKLVNTPLFPSLKSKLDRDGNTISRPTWDLIRGFVAGLYTVNGIPRVVLFCKQNMSEILENSSVHRTKRRFYIEGFQYSRYTGVLYADGMYKPVWKFDARFAVFEFVEFYSLGEYLFEQFYPYMEDCQILGVKLRKLTNTACIEPIWQNLSEEHQKWVRDYLCECPELQPLSADFAFDESKVY